MGLFVLHEQYTRFHQYLLPPWDLQKSVSLALIMTGPTTSTTCSPRVSSTVGGCGGTTTTTVKLSDLGALSGKMLLVRIVANNKIDAYFREG